MSDSTNAIKQEIFIGGCDRSGTTLLGDLLGHHPQTITTPESQFKADLLVEINQAGRPDFTENSAQWVEKLLSHPRFKLWKLSLDLSQVPDFDDPSQLLRWVVGKYIQEKVDSQPEIWIDHTPLNMKHGKLLKKYFPDSQFVHIVRDGRAVANSIVDLDWGPNYAYKAAHYWVERIAYGFLAECLFDDVIRVSFEALVTETRATLERICDFCGLPEPSLDNYTSGVELPDHSKYQHELVGSPPDPSRAEAWRDELSSHQIGIFEQQAGYMLDYLNYLRITDSSDFHLRGREKLYYEVGDVVKRWINKFKKIRRWNRELNEDN